MTRHTRRLTPGRTVLSAGAPVKVQWHAANLDLHYAKHPGGRDRACWTDLLNSQATQVSKQDYEQESYLVVQDPQLHYARREEPEDEVREVFVDGRLIQTITGPPENDTLSICTCYHRHFDKPATHVPGHRTVPSEVLVREYMTRLERDRDSNSWDLLKYRKRPQTP